MAIGALWAQSPDVPDWQTAAGGKMAFEVASVKLMKPGKDWIPRAPLFPLDRGNAVAPGGRFFADFGLWTYIWFAYKLALNPEEQSAAVAQFPKGLSTEYYEIEARASGNASKDQMRLMMQSLLAERFKLAIHFETHEVPVLTLTLDKPGKLGPKLRPHSEGPACPEFKSRDDPASPQFKAGDPWPPSCDTVAGSFFGRPSGSMLVGSRNATAQMLADTVYSAGSLTGEIDDKPVVDRTGLDGTFD
jgi:bla regulator protein blaR1